MPILPPILYPLINGVRFDHSSLEFGIAGIPSVFAGITEVDYNYELIPGELRGLRPQVIGRTRGKYSADLSITMAKAEWELLKQTLSVAAGLLGQGFMEIAIPIVMNYGETGVYVTDVANGCRVKKVNSSSKEGGDALMNKIDFSVLSIIPNGNLPYDPTKFLL